MKELVSYIINIVNLIKLCAFVGLNVLLEL